MTAVPATQPGTHGSPAANGASLLAGCGTLIRFALRRDRVRIPVWVAAIGGGSVLLTSSFGDLYPTPADRAELGGTMNSPAALALTGPQEYLAGEYHIGAMMGHQMLGFTAVLVGLMSVLLFVRHTRAEEESGRAELVRAGVVGRYAGLVAALVAVTVANVAVAAVLAVGMASSGADGVTAGGSLLYGAAHLAAGLVFVGVVAVTAQISQYSRGASGMAMAVVGVAYALRAAGDSSDNILSWVSPVGWVQQTMVYVDDHWWPLALAVAAAAVLVVVAVGLSARRDVGFGLRVPRPGAAAASELLSRPVGFALRLHRAILIGFAVGMALFGAMYGSILSDVEAMLESFPEDVRQSINEIGGSTLAESFASMIMVILAVVTSIYVVLAVLKMRSEESAGRVEPVLSTTLSRTGWAVSHLVVAMVGSAVVMVAAGLGFGAAGAAATGDNRLYTELLLASLAYVPALWIVAGIGMVLYGWWPQATGLSWAVVAYAFVVGYLGQLLDLPESLNALSPFGHVPQLPADEYSAMPTVLSLAVAFALVAIGLVGLRRRDMEST